MRRGLTLLCILILSTAILCGQEVLDSSSIEPDFVYEKENSFKSVFYGQPGKAALYSLIAPGAGQVYNKRWWKVPLVWAGEGYLIYNLGKSIMTLQNWENCRNGLIKPLIAPNITPICPTYIEGKNIVHVTDVSTAFEQQQSAKASKERAWLFLIGAHLIQTLEAFVDRHLINFNTEEDLTILTTPQTPLDLELNKYASSSITVFSVSINLNRLSD